MFCSKYTMLATSKSISGFDPRSIVGCSLWLDGADTATMNSTPTVTSWTDKSGQGYTVTGTATYSAGTMTFNGTNQAFSNTSYVFPSNAYSMFAVYSNTTAPGATSYMNVVYGSGGYPMVGVYGSSKFVSARSVVANTGALSPNVAASNVLVSATYTPSTFSPFINGSAETTLAGTTLAATGLYVGGPTNYFGGSISEILVYSATLTSTQRQSIEGYLAWKWGIKSSLPATHPFYSLPAFSRPFGPTDIPGCALWLDAADQTTLSSVPIPTAYFPFDNSIIDQSNVITLTTTGSVPYVTGKYGQAVSFSNAAGAASSNYLSSTYAFPATFTASMWFQALQTRSTIQTFFYTNSNVSHVPGGIEIYTVNSQLWCAYTNVVNTGVGYPITNGTWYHVAITYNSGSTAFYINGVQSGSNITGTNSKNGFSLGGSTDPGPSYYPFTGYVDDLRIFTSVLTAAQISNIYTNNTSFTSNVAGWYDKSGNGNTAIQNTLSNQPTYGTYLSYPGISFNGSATQLLASAYSQAGTGGRNTFVVFYDINTTSDSFGNPSLVNITGTATAGSRWGTNYIPTTNTLAIDIGSANKPMTASTAVTSMRTQRCIAMWGAPTGATINTTYAYGNGTQFSVTGSIIGSGTAMNTAALGTTIGGSVVGVISEILHYSTELTASQRQQVEGYLAAKWGLLNNLPGKTSSPLNIPGCALWLDASDATTISYSGSAVISINEKAQGITLSAQGTSSFLTTPAASIGSLQSLWFNNSNAQNVYLSGSFQSVTTGCAFMVWKSLPQNAVSWFPIFTWWTGGGTFPAYGYLGTTTNLTVGPYTTYGGNGSPTYVTTSNINYLAFYSWSGTTTAVGINGATPSSGTQPAFSSSTTTFRVGSDTGTATNMNLGELIIYNTALSTTQRQSIENYLMSKWGISNVTTHPFKSIPPSTSQPPQFQEVTPGNWTRDWQPYLQRLAAANSSGVTVTTSTITGGATYITNGWAGGVLGPDGNIYFTPSNAANILKLNVTTGVTTNITGGATYTTGGWAGGVLAPNGNIYFCPYNATNILVLNPTTGVTSNLTGGATYTSGGWVGGVVGPDGNIYCCPIGATNILKLNVSTGVTTNITGGATYTATGWVCGQVGPDGNIYFTPVFATNILKLDPSTGVTTNITGGATILSNGYRGGTLGLDGNIYSAPYSSANILKFSVSPPTVTTITGGATMSSAWQGGVLAADGNIYFLPNSASSLIRLNTTTGVTTNITGGATYTNQGWIGGVLAPDGNIYSGPYFSSSILKITFSGLSQLPSLRYCLSPWTNKF